MASEKVVGDVSISENANKKELLVSQVKGKVKWFNVELGYGFINRDDTNEDVFVHHTAIVKYNTRHQLSSLADGELVEFDVVQGKKGQEAANVCGPNGEQVKGSRFASNLYAGRFRFRRGVNYDGGRRSFSRRQYRDRSAKESQSEETKQGDDEKIPADGKEVTRSKKYSRNRKIIGGEGGRLDGPDGRLKRSSSLPSDLGRLASGNGYRRRRRGPRTSDGRPFLRSIFSGPKRRGPRISEKEYSGDKVQEQKVEDAEPHKISLKSEKEGRGEGELKGSVKGRKPSGRRTNQEGKSEKTDEHSSIEKSDKSQPSRGRKRNGRRSKKNSEVAGEKFDNSQSAPEDDRGKGEDDRRKGKDDSGDGNNGNGRPRRGGGRWRKRGGRPGGRSSSTELSTQTPSTREGEDTKSHGGNGDGGKSESGAVEGNIVQAAVPEVVAGKA